MKTKFSPASDTLAVMTLRPATEPVAKLTISQDCVLLTLIVSIVRGILTPYRESHISLKAGQTIYFVASEREGYSYIVFLYADGTSLCSCKDGCQHRTCQHTTDAASFEACRREEAETEEEKIARVAEEVGVPVGEVALIAALAKSFNSEPESINPVEEARTFIAWVLKDKARKAGYAA